MKKLFNHIGKALRTGPFSKIAAAVATGVLFAAGFLFDKYTLVKHAAANRSGEGYVDTAGASVRA